MSVFQFEKMEFAIRHDPPTRVTVTARHQIASKAGLPRPLASGISPPNLIPTLPPQPSSPNPRFPACPHYSPRSLPTTPPAAPSGRAPQCRLFFLRSLRAPRLSPLLFRCWPHSSSSHPPAPIPHRSPAPLAQAPQTPSSSATLPNRSAQTASKTLSTFCTKSAAQLLPCARLS